MLYIDPQKVFNETLNDMIRLGFQFALTSFLILNGCGAADSSKDANSDKLFTHVSERVKLNGRAEPPKFLQV